MRTDTGNSRGIGDLIKMSIGGVMEEKSIVEESVIEAYKEPVPYIVYQGTMARFERIVRRLITALIVAVVMIAASNIAWLLVFNSYDVVSEEVSADSNDGGNANYIGASGVINNGEGSSEKENAAKEK